MSNVEPIEKRQPIHHLMRVKVRKKVWEELVAVAHSETKLTGEPTTVSDIVRAALGDWLKVYNTLQMLKELEESSVIQKKMPG